MSDDLGQQTSSVSLTPPQSAPSSSLQSHLYLLVTDQGFLQEEQVVWESLHNVDGDSCFCDSDFHLSHSLDKGPGAEGGSGSPEKQRQVDQVCGAFGKGAESTFTHVRAHVAVGQLHAFDHPEIVARDTHAPSLCYLWTLSCLLCILWHHGDLLGCGFCCDGGGGEEVEG